VEKSGSKSLSLRQPGHELQNWAFDYVAGDSTSQEEMFQGTGRARSRLAPLIGSSLFGNSSNIGGYLEMAMYFGSRQEHWLHVTLHDEGRIAKYQLGQTWAACS